MTDPNISFERIDAHIDPCNNSDGFLLTPGANTNHDIDIMQIKYPRSNQIITCNNDVLACVVAMQESGVSVPECVDFFQKDKGIIKVAVTEEHTEQSRLIKCHFKNNIMLRRLASKPVSAWMECADDVSDSSNTINADYIRIITTLPRFYLESKNTEALLKGKVSVSAPELPFTSIDERFEFLGMVERTSSMEKQNRYYFVNAHNNVLGVFVDLRSGAQNVWDYVVKLTPHIHIHSEKIRVGHQPGHDLRMYLLGNDYKIAPVE